MKHLILSLILGCTFPTVCCAFGDLSDSEENTLKYMREEEKLARDVYLEMYDTWEHQVFANISESEQRHMDAMLKMIKLYGLDDPVDENARGEFTDLGLGELYWTLVGQGKATLLDAFLTGASIEDKDMFDLMNAIAGTDEDPLKRAYSNLLSASCNHLRAFVGHIIDQEGSFEPEFLSPLVYEKCVNLIDDVPLSDGSFSINPGLNDNWYYPGTDGQGFVITVYPGAKVLFLIWLTYGIELPTPEDITMIGNPGQRWLAAAGPYSGKVAELELFSMFGGIFDDPDALPVPDYDGSISLQFENCDSGTVSYNVPSAGLSGTVPIQRVNSDNVAHCLQEQHRNRNHGDSTEDSTSDG